MQSFDIPGSLIAVDGPNGVGKTTLIEIIATNLQLAGYKVLKTKEPTASELGRWIREKQNSVRGRSLACLVAANRYEHIESVIQPALANGLMVLTDRYLASSFVYQISDDVSSEFVWAVNSQSNVADLTICLFAEKDAILKRRAGRKTPSRFEIFLSPAQEILLYRNACKELRKYGWVVVEYLNDDGCAETIGKEIADIIIQKRSTKNG